MNYEQNESPPTNTLPLEPITPLVNKGRLVPSQSTPLNECPTNIDINTYEGKKLLIAAGNPGDIDFDDNGEVQVVATHYAIFPDQGTDPNTGEVHEFSRTVLFEKDGKMFRTTSSHMPHRLKAILALFRPDDWKNGISFVIKERQSRKTKRTYHDVRLA